MRAGRALVPTGADMVFSLLALLVPIGLAAPLLNSDGDLARHLRIGEHMLANREIVDRDHFAFPTYGEPYLDFEWLSQVSFALAHRAGGLSAVAVLAGLILAASYALVAVFLRRRGADPLLAFGVAGLSAVTGVMHWLARPHIFTFLAVVALLFLVERREPRRVWLFAPLFVLWTNLHGGYLFGLIVIGVYVAGDLAELAVGSDRREWAARARYHGAALGVAAAASLANPYGLTQLTHILGLFGTSYLVDNTAEFRSPDFHTWDPRIFLATVILLLVTFAVTKRRPELPRLFLLAATTGFAFYAVRNIPLFALTALPVIALELDPEWRRIGWLRRWREAFAAGDRAGMTGGWSGAVGVVLVALALKGGVAGGVELVPGRFDADRFPVEAVERARAARLDGRMFNEFIWGGYILYAWPEQRIFIDGQTDHYGEALARNYVRVVQLGPGWRSILDNWEITLALIPPRSALAHQLVREPGWSIWHCDRTAVLLRRGVDTDGEAGRLEACAAGDPAGRVPEATSR